MPKKEKKNNSAKIITVLLALIIIASLTIYIYTTLVPNTTLENQLKKPNDIITDEDETVLTILFRNLNYTYTLQNLQSYEPTRGIGQYINRVGSLSDINNYTGITVTALFETFDNLTGNYTITAVANDEYSVNYSYNEINGIRTIYNQTGTELGTSNVTLIIAYLENDTPISNESGGPLRIAFVNEQGSITSSSKWMRYLEKIVINEN